MIVHLITAVVLSLIFLLMTWAVFRTLRKPMPGSLIPIVLGATVILYGGYSEYTWASRTLDKMPESMEVVQRGASKSMFSPWAYVVPRTDSLSVVDTNNIRRNPEFKAYAMLDLLILQRFNPVLQIRQLVDCQNSRRTDLRKDTTFDAQGLPENVQWQDIVADHRLIEVVCTES